MQNPLSPLDHIRQAEAEITRQVVLARESAGKIVLKACAQANQATQQGKTDGEHEGLTRYKEILKKSEEEATALVVEAQRKATRLRKTETIQMDSLVTRIVRFVAGLEEDI